MYEMLKADEVTQSQAAEAQKFDIERWKED